MLQVQELDVPHWAVNHVQLQRKLLNLPERVTDRMIYARLQECGEDAGEYVTRERVRRLRVEVPWQPKLGAKTFMPPRLRTVALDEVDVLYWIETNSHHEGDASNGKGFALRGYGTELFIPRALFHSKLHYTVARDPFDTRMYRATSYGNRILNLVGLRPLIAKIQQRRPAR